MEQTAPFRPLPVGLIGTTMRTMSLVLLACTTLCLSACAGDGAASGASSSSSSGGSDGGLASSGSLVGASSGATPASSSSRDGSSAGSSASVGAASSAGSLGAGVCNALVNEGSDVVTERIAQSAPVPAGGDVVPGTYVLTSSALYTGVGGDTSPVPGVQRHALLLEAGAFQLVSRAANNMDLRGSSAWSTSNTEFTIRPVCPTAGAEATRGYTATPTTLTWMASAPGYSVVVTYTKR